MMTFYAAAGSYQIRKEDGKDMPYIMRLGKLQPVSIPEFSIWSTATSHSLSRNRTNNWKEVSSHDRNNLFRPEEWHDVQPSPAEPRLRSPRACC